MTQKSKFAIACLLVVLGFSLRLLPHLGNFAPIAAIALLAGSYLGWRYAAIVPLAATFLSDCFLGFYEWPVILAVYGSYLVIGLMAGYLKNRQWEKIVLASFLASLFFFITTNFAVWAFSTWYPKSLAGLAYCFYVALPFFRNTMLGDLFFSAALFGSWQVLANWQGYKAKTMSQFR